VSDNTLYLPRGFSITQDQKFRNQQVIIRVEIPIGKKIQVDKSIEFYNWFNVNFGGRRYWKVDWEDDWNNNYSWSNEVEYIMTADGLERTHKLKDDGTEEKDVQPAAHEKTGGGYRYKTPADSVKPKVHKDSTIQKASVKQKDTATAKENNNNAPGHDTFLPALIQM
jgi:uncharacterized protein YraI